MTRTQGHAHLRPYYVSVKSRDLTQAVRQLELQLPNTTSPWPRLCCKQQHSINSKEMSSLKINQGPAKHSRVPFQSGYCRQPVLNCPRTRRALTVTRCYASLPTSLQASPRYSERQNPGHLSWQNSISTLTQSPLQRLIQLVGSFVRHLQKSNRHIYFMGCRHFACLTTCIVVVFFLFLFNT